MRKNKIIETFKKFKFKFLFVKLVNKKPVFKPIFIEDKQKQSNL